MSDTKRIKDLAVTTSPNDDDILAVDNSSNGTRGVSFLNLAQRVFNRIGFSSLISGGATFSGTLSATDFTTGSGHSLNAKADKTQVDTLQGQINAAISAVSTDTELVDIRVKADGTTAASAGAAVRAQVEDLQDQIDNLNITVTDDNNGTVTLSFG